MGRGAGSSRKPHHLRWLRRALGAARDFYVRSVTGCAGRLPGDAAAFGCPTFGGGMPSFSASSSRRSVLADDDDLRELIRAASQRRRAAAEAEAAARATMTTALPRSQSVAMARIDEDRPCDFGAAGAAMFLPRSRTTCAAGRMSTRGRVAALAA